MLKLSQRRTLLIGGGVLLVVVGIVLIVMLRQSNKPIVSYVVDDSKKVILINTVVEDFSSLYAQVSPEEMQQVLSNTNTLELVVLGRIVEPEIFIKEAQSISNYLEDPTYTALVDQQKKVYAYQYAFTKGRQAIQDQMDKQKIPVVEVSRIMFTNDGSGTIMEDTSELETLLEELLVVEDLVNEFAIYAEQHSQEPVGAQTGGYLGRVIPDQYPSLDGILFEEEFEGLYPDVIVDELGAYILFVHTKAKEVTVGELKETGLTASTGSIEQNYIGDNIEYLYTFENSELKINNKVVDPTTLKDTSKLIKFWRKSYSLKELKETANVLSQGMLGGDDNQMFLQALAPQADGIPSVLALQMGIIYKGMTSSFKNSKEYKDSLKESLKSIELESVYGIMTESLYKDMSTNVSPKALEEFYADTNNRIIKSMDSNNEPVYQSLSESKDQLSQMILTKRVEKINSDFRSQLAEKYQIEWVEENKKILVEKLSEDYDKYSAEQSIY